MDKLQKILNEVERLQNELITEKKKGYGSDVDDACILELQNIKNYIKFVQKELVSEELEKEINKEIIKLHTAPCYDELKAFALHFAEWQKQQDIEIIELAKKNALVIGKESMKEQMMKKCQNAYVTSQGTLSLLTPINTDYKVGDRVKVIVIRD